VFAELVEQITKGTKNDSDRLIQYVDTAKDFIGILKQIGTIPESIRQNSTSEKLFAKVSDAVLSRAFREIGLKSTPIKKRANSADVQAESIYHDYSLVADAKVFRMSRTAKNQKDFKIASLSGWKKGANFSVLCAPFFHYPKSQSQIYSQAIEYNVCLLSWENLIFLITHGFRESPNVNLSKLWNYSGGLKHTVLMADSEKCFLNLYKDMFLSFLRCQENEYAKMIEEQILLINQQGLLGKTYWEGEKAKIISYTKEKAIKELIKASKIDEKINHINQFTRGIRHD